MRVECFLRIGSGRLPAHRSLIAGMKLLEDGEGRTRNASSVNVRRSVIALSQERVGHARAAAGIAGSFWPLQLSLLNGKGRVCA